MTPTTRIDTGPGRKATRPRRGTFPKGNPQAGLGATTKTVWHYIDLHGALDGILQNTAASGVSGLEKWERAVHDMLNQEHVPMAIRDEVRGSGGTASLSERPNPDGASCNLIEAIVQSRVQEESAGAMVERAIENAIPQINGQISGLSQAGWDQVLAHVETSDAKPSLDLKSRGRIGKSMFYCSPVPLVRWESYETSGSNGGGNSDNGGSPTGFAVVGARRSGLVVEGTGSLDRLRQEGGTVQVVAVGDIDPPDNGDDPPTPVLQGLSDSRRPPKKSAGARRSPTAPLNPTGRDDGARGLSAHGLSARGLGAQATYTFEVPSGGVTAISGGRYRVQINQSVPQALQTAISQGQTIPFTVRSYQGGSGNGGNGDDGGNGNGGSGGNGGGGWGGGWDDGSGGNGGSAGPRSPQTPGPIIAGISGSTLAIGGASLFGALLIGALASDEQRPRPPPPPPPRG